MTEPETEPAAPAPRNAIGRMLGLLGDQWTLLIAMHSLLGLRRFGQFHGALAISNSVLTQRLARMQDTGLLDREIYRSNPLRAEYVPTQRCATLWPTLVAIRDWEGRWGSGIDPALPGLVHAPCGTDLETHLVCGACGAPARARDVSAEWGPSGSWERSVPESSTRRRPEVEPSAAGLFPETMAIFGNRWSSALIGAIFRGLTRFSDFEAALGAPPSLIADRLRVFCALGVLDVEQHPRHPGRPEYQLTAKGRAFFPVIATSLHWADAWLDDPDGPAVRQTHLPCGSPFVGRLACRSCSAPLSAASITIVPAGADRDTQGGSS